MKRIFISIMLTLLYLTGNAQTVSNVTSRLEGSRIAVSFNLKKTQHCVVSYSTDGGKNFSPCNAITGDTNNSTIGIKTIYWDFFADGALSGNFLFKVEAELIEMVFVQGGTFQMGSNDGEKDETPIHSVTLSDFNIGKYEVTQAQWQAVMGNNPSRFKGDNLPVENVSWNDVQEFIGKLNTQTGKQYRMPTEAEWEYAARGGNQSRGYTYSGSNTIDEVAWYGGNSNSETHPVGNKSKNELGIYDMSGNVWEWCSDWYGSYSSSTQTNPTGAATGSRRLNRGGSWSYLAQYCRVAGRYYISPDYRRDYLGIRLVSSR